MKTRTLAFVALTAFCGSSANAADQPATPAAVSAAQPSVPMPAAPPPPAQIPAPPHAQPIEPARTATNIGPPLPAAPSGQWVYTDQYGWLWMPYDESYTRVVSDAALAYMFVFYPTFGWRWVVSPWVLGFGGAPYWGPLGPGHFAFYAHQRFRVPAPYRGAGWGRAGRAFHSGGRGRR